MAAGERPRPGTSAGAGLFEETVIRPRGDAPPGRGRTVMGGDKHRLRFAKTDALRLLSHHDLMRCCERMLRRAQLPFKMTGGFHPTPRWVFALSLPLGVNGRNEVAELELTEPLDPADVLARLREQSPAGLYFTRCDVVPLKASAVPRRAVYTLPLPPDRVAPTAAAVAALLAEPAVWLDKSHPKPRRVNVRPYLRNMVVADSMASGGCKPPVPATGNESVSASGWDGRLTPAARQDMPPALTLDLWVTGQGTVRAEDLLKRLGLADVLAAGAVLERTDLEIADEVPPGATDAPPDGPPETLPLTHPPATSAGDDPHPAPTAGTWGLSPAGPVVE